ncbi:MAG: cupin domain-containing protein [Armatimonadota bacterium]|nr:MAG: cupin domain-containing protein [Armatimonadota bacterium]
MLRATFDKQKAELHAEGAAYLHPIFAPEDVGARLHHAWIYLKPGDTMAMHLHDEAELCVVREGQGEIRVENAAAAIRELDAILIPPGAEHSIANTGEGDLTIFWASWKPVGPVLVETGRVAIESFDRARLKPAHMDTFYHFEPFSTETMGAPARFTTGWGLVGGGVASELHKHPTAELYVFFRGATVQQVGLECAAVKASDAVMVPADTMHNLLNYTDDEVLLYWIEVIPGSLPE